jgi:hypothetical protein
MNMKKFNDALSNIDYDIVDEFLAEKEAIGRKKSRRRTISILTPIAACLVIFVSVGSVWLGYNMALDKNENKSETNLEMILEKDGKFVFEYQGKRYQAFVTPMAYGSNVNFAEGESISIKNVGELITTVDVTDEYGKTATMEIYSSKGDFVGSEILLKLDNGYFLAKGVD